MLTFPDPASAMVLQWGHDFLAVEMLVQLPSWMVLYSASMGPRLSCRGNDARCQYCKAGEPFPASMGPRLSCRGNMATLTITELMASGLQWGHDFLAVEILLSHGRGLDVLSASMGPRLSCRGNIFEWIYALWIGFWLQWGHDFLAVEIFWYLRV